MESVAVYPRLLRRVRAVLVDTVIAVFVIFGWFAVLPLLAEFPWQLKVSILLVIWFVLDPLLVWRIGGTPGHYFMSLRIQDKSSGENIGVLRAVFRALTKLVTGAWSLIFILLTKKHQALHDLIFKTTVVLNNPEKVPAWERHNERRSDNERILDQDGYSYPAIWRKCLVIVAYVVIFSLVFFALIGLIIPAECFLQNNCKENEKLTLLVLDWVWFFAVAILVVYGWRSRLYGARRQRNESYSKESGTEVKPVDV